MNKPRLKTLILEMTQDCDHACRYCYNPWRHPDAQPASTRPRADVCALLAHVLAQVDCGHVTLTGGEPLLCPDLSETVRFLAPSRRARQRRHQRPPSDRRPRSRTCTKRCEPVQRVTVEPSARGPRRPVWQPRRGRGAAHLDLLPSLDQVREAFAVANATAAELGLSVAVSVPIQPCLVDMAEYPHLNFGFCAAGADRAYYTLDWAGNVRPCNHSATVLGNVWDRAFADIITGKAMAQFTAALPPFCKGCRMRTICQGGRKAAAEVCYGNLRAEEPFLRANLAWARPLT